MAKVDTNPAAQVTPGAGVGVIETEWTAGERFRFGRNWQEFLSEFSEQRLQVGSESLKSMLECESLSGRSFLDAGCGSGLFSLAARKLGACVTSFDYDPDSVQCAGQLKAKFYPGDKSWVVERGSVLDHSFLTALGQFDVVYSWGVLHHTGAMWDALAEMAGRVKDGGKLFISIYNDQGRKSRVWSRIKRFYCRAPRWSQPGILAGAIIALWGPRTILDFARLKPFETWRAYRFRRGMSPVRDVEDWIGGYPFEVAKPEEIVEFYLRKGFALCRLKTTLSFGTNEYVFRKLPGAAAVPAVG